MKIKQLLETDRWPEWVACPVVLLMSAALWALIIYSFTGEFL